MLVLSRRTNEKIIFPTINTTVQIVSLKSGTVRLGIQAPGHVPVYREEVLDPQIREQVERELQAARDIRDNPGDVEIDPVLLLHQMNNRLNCSSIGVALLRRQLELGLNREMASTITRVEQELAALRENLVTLDSKNGSPDKRYLVGKRTLLVEDDENECELLAGFLRLAGIEVNTARDGIDALDLLNGERKPDIVVLDMLMPRCDGPSTVRAIRNNPVHAGVKIIGVTGVDPQRFGLPDGPTGIDRWFAKPLNPEVLLRELQAQVAC